MLAFAIIKDFDIFETCSLHFGMGSVAHAMNPFVLETVKPALGGRVDAPMSRNVRCGRQVRED
jgi:hypothetical protein